MKRILLAISNAEDYKDIYNCLNRGKEVQIYNKDILYEEAVFEVLENQNYNELIISEDIISDLNKYKKILKKGISIQIIVEDERNVDDYKKHGFYNVKTKNDYIYKSIYKNRKIEDIKIEINRFKNIINESKNAEIIAFTGERKSGKTTVAINYLNKFENKKVLYLNLNYNNDILYFLNEELNPLSKVFYREINQNEIAFNIYFDIKNSKTFENYIKMVDNQYEIIIIDIDYTLNLKYLKTIFSYCNKVFFIINPIIVEINNSIKKIEKFVQEEVLDMNKIRIIFNNYDSNSINISVLQEVFKRYEIDCVYKKRKRYRNLLNKEVKNGIRS